MNNNIVGRLGEFIDYLEMNHSSFSKKLGYTSQEKISRLFRKKGAKPSYELIFDIANKFVGTINAEWLLLGKGNMINGSNQSMDSNNKLIFQRTFNEESGDRFQSSLLLSKSFSCELCKEKNRTIEALQKTVKAQEITIERLLEKVEELTASNRNKKI